MKVIRCLDVFIIMFCIVVESKFECFVIFIFNKVISIVLSGVKFVKFVIRLVMICCRFLVLSRLIILIILLGLCLVVFFGCGLMVFKLY